MATKAAKTSGNRAKTRRAPPATQRKLDARPDTLDFRDLMYVPTLVEVPTHVPLDEYSEYEVPVLDQGKEGACTGFGLATVAHYLLLRRRVLPDRIRVSPRMLYGEREALRRMAGRGLFGLQRSRRHEGLA